MGDADVLCLVFGRGQPRVIARRLIVFDLDGTLIDSRRDLTAAANALVVERGGMPLDDAAVARMVGEGAALLVRRALTAAGLPVADADVTRFLELYGERLLDTTRPYDGMRAALEALRGEATLAVLTNKPLGPAVRLLDALDLAPLFTTTIGGDGPHPRKPDPASLRALMLSHGTGPASTVMVGDTRIDFETARAAGTHLCVARYGFGFEQFPLAALTGTEALVDSPSEIPAATRHLFGSMR